MIPDYWDTPIFRKRCKQAEKVHELAEKVNGSMDDLPSATKMTRRMISLQRYLNGLGLDKRLKNDLKELAVLRHSMKDILEHARLESEYGRETVVFDIADKAVNHWREA